jgi:hypothetical protein
MNPAERQEKPVPQFMYSPVQPLVMLQQQPILPLLPLGVMTVLHHPLLPLLPLGVVTQCHPQLPLLLLGVVTAPGARLHTWLWRREAARQMTISRRKWRTPAVTAFKDNGCYYCFLRRCERLH